MVEQWKPVVDYVGLYEVSDQGRVRSLDRVIPASNRWGPCLRRVPARPMTLTNRLGYLDVCLARSGRSQIHKVHRLVLQAFVGACPPGMEARHLNGNSLDNRLVNLTWGTPSENESDKVLHGTHNKAKRTHCPRKHPLDAPNLEPGQLAVGKRSCWACSLARGAAKRRGSTFDFDQFAAEKLVALIAGWRPGDRERQTVCMRGHELIPSNVRTGTNSCRACGNARSRARWLHKQGLPADLQVISDEYFARLIGRG